MAFGKKNDSKGNKASGTKKKFIYLALDKESNLPILDKEGKIIVSNSTEDGKAPDWGDKLEKVKVAIKNVVTNSTARQEVVKNEGEENRDAKLRAIAELEEKYKGDIDKAKALKNKPTEEKKAESDKTADNDKNKAEKKVEVTENTEEQPEAKKETTASSAEEQPEVEENKEHVKEETKQTETPVDKDDAEKKADNAKKVKKVTKKEDVSEIEDDVDVILDSIVETSRKVEKKVDEVRQSTDRSLSLLSGMYGSLSDGQKTIGSSVVAQAKKIMEGQEKLSSSTDRNFKKIDEIAERTEMFEGQFKKLDQIDALTQTLSDKGLEIKKTAAPTSREEEDIVNMSKYAVAIIDQLTIAACELVKKQAEYEKQDGYKANSEQEMKAQIEEERISATKKAKIDLISAIFNKFTDIEDLLNKENQLLSLVMSALTEQGVEIDGNGSYKKGEKVEINAADAEKMAAKYSGINGSGKYVVTKTGLSFQGETVFKAEFEKQAE